VDYTGDQLRQAFLDDEVARLQVENQGLFAFGNTRRPSYGIVPDPEVTVADLTDDDIDGALAELREQRGVSVTELSEQVLILTGGERDAQSRAMAVLELASMDVVSLAAKASNGKKAKKAAMDDEDPDDEDEDEDDFDGQVTGPKPRKPSKRHKATKPVQVRKRGQDLLGFGEGGNAEGGGGASGAGEGGAMAASAPRRALVRAGDGSLMTVALSEDEAWASAEVDRLAQENPRICLSAKSNFTVQPGRPDLPGPWDTPGTTAHMEKAYDFEVHDVGGGRRRPERHRVG
jgi:hypothetical protein